MSNVGGPSGRWGDGGVSRRLAECLDVRPPEELPFTHGFHAYPARMHPETAQRVLDRFAPGPGARVLDPFVGSGTTAVEAIRSGHAFAGGDISRVALEIAWARTRVWTPDECRRVERDGARAAAAAEREIDRAPSSPPWAGPLRAWYDPHTLREICLLREVIRGSETGDVRRMLVIVLSSLMVKLSRQASESAAIPSRDARSWPRGAALRLFRGRCSELTRALLRLGSDVHKRRIRTPGAHFVLADARRRGWKGAAFDLVATSPPYPGTYDYAFQHRLRHPLFDDDGIRADRHEIGARRNVQEIRGGFAQYRADLCASLAGAAEGLKRGAWLLVLIGDGVLEGQKVQADDLVRDVAAEAVLTPVAGAVQRRRNWSQRDRGGSRGEHLIALRA